VRTVQGAVEEALARLLDRPGPPGPRIDLAGRTDTGVHAAAQEIAFEAAAPWTAAQLHRALSAILPSDVALTRLRNATPDFHPRFDAQARRYEYVVDRASHGNPFLRNRVWPRPCELDVERLGAMARHLPGERSFEGFAKAGQPERGTRCAVEAARWISGPGSLLRFEIAADRFLHHMVRYLVGTMVEIAMNRRPAADLASMLKAEIPSRAVFPAPPRGLYLTGVRYPDGWNRDPGIPWLPEPPRDPD